MVDDIIIPGEGRDIPVIPGPDGPTVGTIYIYSNDGNTYLGQLAGDSSYKITKDGIGNDSDGFISIPNLLGTTYTVNSLKPDYIIGTDGTNFEAGSDDVDVYVITTENIPAKNFFNSLMNDLSESVKTKIKYFTNENYNILELKQNIDTITAIGSENYVIPTASQQTVYALPYSDGKFYLGSTVSSYTANTKYTFSSAYFNYGSIESSDFKIGVIGGIPIIDNNFKLLYVCRDFIFVSGGSSYLVGLAINETTKQFAVVKSNEALGTSNTYMFYSNYSYNDVYTWSIPGSSFSLYFHDFNGRYPSIPFGSVTCIKTSDYSRYGIFLLSSTKTETGLSVSIMTFDGLSIFNDIEKNKISLIVNADKGVGYNKVFQYDNLQSFKNSKENQIAISLTELEIETPIIKKIENLK